MVCLGNICRSPIAEAVFQHIIKERGLEDSWFVDSAATSREHIGGGPDYRASRILKNHGIVYKHTVRRLCPEDFDKFDWIFGMDNSNIRDINAKKPANSKAVVQKLGDYHPNGSCIIEDPYYDSDDRGFEECYQRCLASINKFLDENSKNN